MKAYVLLLHLVDGVFAILHVVALQPLQCVLYLADHGVHPPAQPGGGLGHMQTVLAALHFQFSHILYMYMHVLQQQLNTATTHNKIGSPELKSKKKRSMNRK